MPNNFTILGPSPVPPMVWGEITLCFDSDRPAGDLPEILPIRPAELVSRSETRYNPTEHRQNPGFLTYNAEKPNLLMQNRFSVSLRICSAATSRLSGRPCENMRPAKCSYGSMQRSSSRGIFRPFASRRN